MKPNKAAALLLVMLLVLAAALSGCGQSADKQDGNGGADQAAAAEESGDAADEAEADADNGGEPEGDDADADDQYEAKTFDYGSLDAWIADNWSVYGDVFPTRGDYIYSDKYGLGESGSGCGIVKVDVETGLETVIFEREYDPDYYTSMTYCLAGDDLYVAVTDYDWDGESASSSLCRCPADGSGFETLVSGLDIAPQAMMPFRGDVIMYGPKDGTDMYGDVYRLKYETGSGKLLVAKKSEIEPYPIDFGVAGALCASNGEESYYVQYEYYRGEDVIYELTSESGSKDPYVDVDGTVFGEIATINEDYLYITGSTGTQDSYVAIRDLARVRLSDGSIEYMDVGSPDDSLSLVKVIAVTPDNSVMYLAYAALPEDSYSYEVPEIQVYKYDMEGDAFVFITAEEFGEG